MVRKQEQCCCRPLEAQWNSIFDGYIKKSKWYSRGNRALNFWGLNRLDPPWASQWPRKTLFGKDRKNVCRLGRKERTWGYFGYHWIGVVNRVFFEPVWSSILVANQPMPWYSSIFVSLFFRRLKDVPQIEQPLPEEVVADAHKELETTFCNFMRMILLVYKLVLQQSWWPRWVL